MLDSVKTSKKLLNIFKLHDKPCLNNLKYDSNSVNNNLKERVKISLKAIKNRNSGVENSVKL